MPPVATHFETGEHMIHHDFEYLFDLGKGAYGNVTCESFNNIKVAMKEVNHFKLNPADTKKYVHVEVKTTRAVKHKHIV
jgi:hypothetical protein